MSDIFLSYAREDRERARILAEALQRYGWTVWWDREIRAGRAFDQAIQEALDAAACEIALWSRHSVTSDWVKDEADDGKRRDILIPVLIEEVEVPLGFRRIQTESLVGWRGKPTHAGFRRLVAAVAEVVNEESVPESAATAGAGHTALHLGVRAVALAAAALLPALGLVWGLWPGEVPWCRTTPTLVAGGLTFASLALNSDYTCGLTTAGQAYCWGDNHCGVLGDGQEWDPEEAQGGREWDRPVAVVGGLTFNSLFAEDTRVCGLTTEGRAFCWGCNDDGVLGDGTLERRFEPVQVAGDFTFASLAIGASHSCGLTEGGQAHCWGFNTSGQLGDGKTTNRYQPVPVTGGLTFRALALGDAISCGITADDKAYCWGYLSQRQESAQPVAVPGDLVFAKLYPRAKCGITTGDRLYCWDYWARLAGVTENDEFEPTLIADELSFTMIAAEGEHVCGLTAQGRAYCWGDNIYGQLGDGTETERNEPVVVAGDLELSSLSVSKGHTCGLTIQGAAYCWGTSEGGRLGDGTQMDRVVPTPVAGGIAFSSLDTVFYRTCGIATDGAAYCWGRTYDGQLGDGSLSRHKARISLALGLAGGGWVAFSLVGGVLWSRRRRRRAQAAADDS